MNYTTFFVVLSTVGVVVFFGIFGAAWMSAADQLKRGLNTGPVKPPTESPNDLPEKEDSFPISANHEISSVTSTQTAFTNSEAHDHASTFNPSSIENSEATTAENPEATTAKKSEATAVENSEATTAENPEATMAKKSEATAVENSQTTSVVTSEIVDGPVRMGPDEISPIDDTCSLEKLTHETGVISPTYENKDTCQQWLVEYEEGYSVDITVDRLELDGEASDYVLISPDMNATCDAENPVFSWTLTEKKYYKIPYKGTAYIRFVTHKSDSKSEKPRGFRIVYKRSGELTTNPPTSTAGPIPDPIEEESINIIAEFSDSVDTKLQQFKAEIAKQANTFCSKINLPLNAGITDENVFLTDQHPCLSTWPHSNTCWIFKMTLPVDSKNNSYELTKEHLQKMWDEWDGEDLIKHGIKKTNGPNYKKNVIIWFLLCIVFIIIFSVFLLFFWQWTLRNSLKPQETKEHESQTIEVPPFIEYMDSKYDDPEYLPYNDSMYDMGTETSTDDRFSYGALPPYTKRPSNVSTFQFGRPSNAGIENNAYLEDEEEEYEIMNRASITKEVKKVDNENEYKFSGSQ